VLRFGAADWQAFVGNIKAGRLGRSKAWTSLTYSPMTRRAATGCPRPGTGESPWPV